MATYHVPYTAAQLEAALGKGPIVQDDIWYVWNIAQMQYVSTGVTAMGETGKSAYQSARDGGFPGTEAEFNELLSDLNAYAERAEDAGDAAKSHADDAADSAATATQERAASQTARAGAEAAQGAAAASAETATAQANRAQAEADRATVPAVEGVYNVVLADRVTSERYALIVESGRLKLLGVASTLDAADVTLIDQNSGTAYGLIVESGNLILEEVG